jgi:acyl-CoA dehydrogenase
MEFSFTEEQRLMAETARKIAKDFPPDYWYEKEEAGEFGAEFWKAISEAGFLGIVIPEEYGGVGLGVTELMLVIQELCENGCGMAGNWYICLTEVFGAMPIVKYGTKEQKEKYLPKIASGELEFCMALTEPNAGTNTFRTETFAKKEGDGYRINGSKIFISGADRAKGMFLIARTTKPEDAPKKTHGITLFLVDLPNDAVKVNPIPKHGINYSKSCEVVIEDLWVPESAVLGEVDKGWYSLLNVLDPERLVFTVASVGIGKLAINYAVNYGNQRQVFSQPVSSYQALQHPLAEAYASLVSSELLAYKAGWLFDNGGHYREIGALANMAKAVAVDNATKAVYWAMQTLGGYGYAKEYHVERWWREINLVRLAPVTQQMALNYIAEHILGMPKSYS